MSPEGLRVDGRRPDEIRKIRCKLGILTRADGSAYYEQGNTKVIAAIYGPREVLLFSSLNLNLHFRFQLEAKHFMIVQSLIVNTVWLHLVRVNEKRKQKETGTSHITFLLIIQSRSQEVSYVIRQTFESAIMTNLFPRSEISIYIQVIQADGGTRCAAINAATLALINAGIPMKDFVVACATGCIDGTTPILDMNYLEESAGGPDLPVALLPASESITMVQMESKVPIEMFEKVAKLAVEGCKLIHQILLQEVEKYTLGKKSIWFMKVTSLFRTFGFKRRSDVNKVTILRKRLFLIPRSSPLAQLNFFKVNSKEQ